MAVILGFLVVTVLWFFVREHRLGRFAPLATGIDEAWLRQHLLAHPAEVVAAAWDERVGSAEVVALIARMVHEGTLQSKMGKGKSSTAAITLRLMVDRETLQGHERVLVDKLFFGGRTETSTSVVRSHYKSTGFSPSAEIAPHLTAAVEAMLPAGQAPWRLSPVTSALLWLGVLLTASAWFDGFPGALAVVVPMGLFTALGWGLGARFRGYLHWGRREALLCLTPVLAIAVAAIGYLWFYAGSGQIELSPLSVAGLVAVTLACIQSATSALHSRRHREALAFRKMLTAGRHHFIDQLGKDQPALRDAWYPWLLAFELAPQMDAWTTARVSPQSHSRRETSGDTPVMSSSSSAAAGTWSGFGGGRSGGAGGGASWQAAVSGMAAGVSAPSSEGSDSSSGGGSSSGGSSGGGGGGGW